MRALRAARLRGCALRLGWALLTLSAPSLVAQPLDGQPRSRVAAQRSVVVASKPFAESYLLAEMFAQLLEARGHAVDRRPGLGTTDVALRALVAGAADVYPEYTGTGLLAVLGDSVRRPRREAFARVSAEFARRFGVRWLPPLGFENGFALTVRRETAERLGVRTLSELARAAPGLRAGFSSDFAGRADGLPGLARAYGLRFASSRPLAPALKYQALAAGEVDVIDGYTTDGLVARHDLVVLDDDRAFFPPYEAAALVSAALLRDVPAAALALTELSGRLDGATMRALNRRVEVDQEPVARVAADALASLGLVRRAGGAEVTTASPGARRAGLARYLWDDRAALARRTGRHLVLTGAALLAACAVAIPLGVLLERRRGAAEPVVRATGVLQTIPGIALLAFMIPVLGIGVAPAIVALFLYALYPIVRNTYTGVRDADPGAVAAAVALGMTPRQVLVHVRLPLAAPLVMAGVRTAAVIVVGTATLAAFVGGGGLGEPIVSGLALSDTRQVLAGAIPAALLAVLVDLALGRAERAVTPRGVRARRSR